jgi:hypothetical protein
MAIAADDPGPDADPDGGRRGRGGDAAEAEPDAEPRPSRARRRRTPPGGETRGRKLHLPDPLHDRLKLVAFQRRTTASAIAAEILDRALPRLRIEREP